MCFCGGMGSGGVGTVYFCAECCRGGAGGGDGVAGNFGEVDEEVMNFLKVRGGFGRGHCSSRIGL